jgi:hypothetical protein
MVAMKKSSLLVGSLIESVGEVTQCWYQLPAWNSEQPSFSSKKRKWLKPGSLFVITFLEFIKEEYNFVLCDCVAISPEHGVIYRKLYADELHLYKLVA